MYGYCCIVLIHSFVWIFFFFQAEDGIRDLVRSRGLGDVYKRQFNLFADLIVQAFAEQSTGNADLLSRNICFESSDICLLYTSDAADERSSVDLGGRRIIKKKKTIDTEGRHGKTE